MKGAASIFSRLGRRRYEIIAVLNGAIVMMLEIVGARFIQPFFGNSIYVWTAVIGVILGALSLGYWYGGRLADRRASDRILSWILIAAAGILTLTLYVKDGLLAYVSASGGDVRWQALIASLALFGPVNFLFGLVSPYLAKLRLTDLATAGRSVGGLYAAGTAGSIVGTFVTGYWLIAWMGGRGLATGLIYGLLLASVIAAWRKDWIARVLVAVAAAGLFGALGVSYLVPYGGVVKADADSAYSHWRVVDREQGGITLRYLSVEQQDAQSGVILGRPSEIPFTYIKRFVEVAQQRPEARRVLIIGGGAYTLPAHLLADNPEMRIDLVEIDPYLDKLATNYFGYRPDERVKVIHADGRVFLNEDHGPYDIIYMDAFNSLSPPFQLTTIEAVARIKQQLAPGGLVAVNLVADPADRFASSEFLTYQKNFAKAQVASTIIGSGFTGRMNLLLLAGDKSAPIEATLEQMRLPTMRPTAPGQLLTDDFAPVEQLTAGF